jgi:PAS domain S-box-containing protein
MAVWERDSFLIRTDSLLESETLMAAIVRSATDAIIAEDMGGRIICWNDAATRLLGHAAEEMIGLQMSRLLPAGRHRDEATIAARARNGARLAPYRAKRLKASGETLHLSVAISPLRDAAHRIIGLSHVLRPAGDKGPEGSGGHGHEQEAARHGGDAILVVEDEVIIGLGLTSTLENAGFNVLGPARSVGEAMELLARHRCALAILDVNLGRDETSAPLAEWLNDVGIPFIVTSGYAPDQRPPVLRDVPSFAKPVGARTIVAAVQAALAA